MEDGIPHQIPSLVVTPNLFSLLGVQPQSGRTLREQDARAALAPVVMSHQAWQRFYGADPAIVGRVVELDDQPHEVVGVLPSDFALTDGSVGFWLALPRQEEDRRSRWLNVIGRMKSDATPQAVLADLGGIARQLAERHPDTNRGWAVDAATLTAVLSEDVPAPMWILQVFVGLVLAAAAFNLAGLMLARMGSRTHELAVRAAPNPRPSFPH